MLPDGGILVDQVWKRFRRFRGRRLAREKISNLAARARGNQRDNSWFWSLADIGFEIEPGESVGLIGANGAGKSTLLKIVSQVMFPNAGHIETAGRVGALLEVMSGIHNDLTGRENAMIYGSLLGLSRKEIQRQFDDIVAFAELEHAIDQHVKFYSSGMKMRLGFSIAAFLQPRILLVDEVLAVGDSAFQQKCMDRMREVLNSGTTLILVSHDLASVGAIASRGLWLKQGRLAADGPIDAVLGAYRREIESHAQARHEVEGKIGITDLVISGPEGSIASANAPLTITFTAHAQEETRSDLYLGITQGAATPIFVVKHQTVLTPGETRLSLTIPRLPVPAGDYFVWFASFTPRRAELTPWQPIAPLPVVGFRLDPVPRSIVRLSPVYVEAQWKHL